MPLLALLNSMHFPKLQVWESRERSLPTGGGARYRRPADFRPGLASQLDSGLAEWLRGGTVRPINAYEWECYTRWRVPLRSVGDDTWFFIRSGSCRYKLGDQVRWSFVREGGLLLIPHGVPHAISLAPGETHVECNTVHFTLRGIGGVSLLKLLGLGGTWRATNCDFLVLNHRLAAEFALRPPGWEHSMTATIWDVLLDITRSLRTLPSRLASHQKQLARIQPALQLFERRYHDPALCVWELAKAASISEVHLRKLVNRVFGSGVVQLINRRRLDRARQLLNETDLGLKEVADASGFASMSLFHRLFRRHFGITPDGYRQRLNAGVQQQ